MNHYNPNNPNKVSIWISLCALFLVSFQSWGASVDASSTYQGGQPSASTDEVYQQVLSFSAGPFHPQSAVISNGTYSYNYGSGATDSFMLEAGSAFRLFELGCSVYISEGLAFSRFSGTPSSSATGATSDSLGVNLIGLDTRLVFAMEKFPVKWFIPFAEGGYQYTFYSQSGSSDLDSVEGGVGNAVAGAGARIWINRFASLNTELKGTYTSIPIFLTVKWNRIFPNGNPMDLADSSVLAGVSVGL